MNKKAKDITDLTGQQIQIILDELWQNENITRKDYIAFLKELVEICNGEINEYTEDV